MVFSLKLTYETLCTETDLNACVKTGENIKLQCLV